MTERIFSVEALEDRLLALGRQLDGERSPRPRHPDQAGMPEWRGADVVVTSNFESTARNFVDGHDLMVRTRHAVAVTWLFLELRDAFSGWLDASNKYGFFGALGQAALAHLAVHQPESEDPRPLLRAVLACAFQWLPIIRENDAVPPNAECLMHVQDTEGRQRRIDMETGSETV
jgi:hypothetical protein